MKIKAIIRERVNGMYRDVYRVIYESGYEREYKIKGEMNNNHFNFIMNAKPEYIKMKSGSWRATIYREKGNEV